MAVAAQHRHDLLQHQARTRRGDAMSRRRRRPLRGVERLRVVDRLLGCPPEDLDLAASGGLLLGRGVDLLEHARHGENQRRLERAHIRHQLGRVGAEAQHGPRGDQRDLHESRERMRERQEHHRRCALLEQDVSQFVMDAGDMRGVVAVGEAHALGSTGGAGGVDDGGEIVRVCGGAARCQARRS